jgi:hypothetical protein
MPCRPLVSALLCLSLFAATASRADNCDAIRAQIDTKIRGSGLANFQLSVSDTDAAASGRVVGSCANGTRRIVFKAGAGASAPVATVATARRPAASSREAILTECLDGSMSVGGTCKK